MQITTTETVPGADIDRVLGVAQGSTVQSRGLGSDIGAGLKNLVGGELKGYSKLMTKARDEALERMEADAREMGADAVVNVRFETSEITQGGAEILAYGTAVTLR
ncbi:YbjQ family protein [Haloarchaeobius sp. HME9146]|uniref:YbjQ family protein n=1 Tax=Haloarchaeobius sp. HME9146 TaxID=2978732 RepID=UPI0021C22B9B|nr:YbjQ family protein [Haloarchaeobius sp. HME9146]MCT9095999.1 YbjQ family protein [Haloarchaeobius sp. HME9146]